VKRPASPGRLAAVAVLVAIPTLAVQAVLVLGGVAVALTWMRATVGASWGEVLAMVVALEALLAMLLGAALVVGVPWRAAALRFRLRRHEVARAQRSRTRAVPLRSAGVRVRFALRAMWVEDGGPRGELDRALAASYPPVDARWAKTTVRMSIVDGLMLDAWLIIGGFARGAVGVLLLTITGG